MGRDGGERLGRPFTQPLKTAAGDTNGEGIAGQHWTGRRAQAASRRRGGMRAVKSGAVAVLI